MLTANNMPFRITFTAVAALIATSAVSLFVVLAHTDTTMAQGAAWPRRPSGTPSPAAAAAPTASPTTSAAATPGTQTSPVAENSPVATSTPTTQAARPPLTYTVKSGDNLTVIAAWFKLQGYGDLYQRNRAVIGSDPDLIRPGQKITISSAGMTSTR